MKKNLAPEAPRVEAATAESAEYTEPATADMVQQSEAHQTSPAQRVEPATTCDDARAFAPKCVLKPPVEPTSSLTVSKLRGERGSDMECYAAILRGAPEKNTLQKYLPMFFDERDFVSFGEVKKYMLVKSATCFVYGQQGDPSPMYAIPLNEVFAIVEDPKKPDKGSITISPALNSNKPREGLVTVLLKYRKNGKQAYQFTFDTRATDKTFPRRFVDLVDQSFGTRGPVTASVVKVDRVARHATKNQPMI